MLAKFLIAATVVIAVLLLLRATRKQGVSRSAVQRVLASIGPARCLAATEVIVALQREADQRATLAVWDAIELPLLQALPDCPPSTKPALMNALDALAKATTNRELAKRVMTLRNGLMG